MTNESTIGRAADGIKRIFNLAPVPYVGRAEKFAIPFSTERPDMSRGLEKYDSIGTLHAIVSRLSETVGAMQWRLYRKHPNGRKEDREEVTKHLALDIWNKPNPFQTNNMLVEAGQQHLELTGEMVLIVERNQRMRSVPLGLWLVRPDRVEPVKNRERFLRGFIYHGPDGEHVPLELDEVLRIMYPSPVDPYRGSSPVHSILYDLDSSRYSAEWMRSFFQNSAQPGGTVVFPEELSDPEWDKFVARWNEQHRGASRAHRVAVLEYGAKFEPRGYSMRDMQFAEVRNVSREIIREAYAFPKPMLGTVDDANRANTEAAEEIFYRWNIVPRGLRVKEMLNSFYLPLFGETATGLEFDFDNPIPQNREEENATRDSKVQAAKSLVEAGFDPQEVLQALELPAMSFTEQRERGGENQE